MKKKVELKDIVLFLIFAFTIPLVSVTLMKYISICSEGLLQLILYGIEGASPAIAAILTVLFVDGGSNLKMFFRMKYRDSFSLKLSLLGLFAPALLLTITKIVTYVTPYHNQFITIPSLKKVIILLWALIAEELGWRGFLQDKLETKFGDSLTPLLVGLIWAAWHYHFFISGSMDVPIVAFTYGCIVESYGYYLITKWAKGNIVPASLWHFSGNVFFNLYLFNPNWNGGSIVPYCIANAVFSIYVVVFVCWKKSRNKKITIGAA